MLLVVVLHDLRCSDVRQDRNSINKIELFSDTSKLLLPTGAEISRVLQASRQGCWAGHLQGTRDRLHTATALGPGATSELWFISFS